MTASEKFSTRSNVVLWIVLLVYLAARICQMDADQIPTLPLVILHVVPPAVLALLHGSILYGRRGILFFTAICIGVAAFCESLSLRTGFPFGHYYFTGVMGPKLFGLPFLLVLAYLGIGYCSWVLALLILGYRSKPLTGTRVVALPVLASFTMLAWDLAMDAPWATVDGAWVWRDGGPFFGVPISNFLGWYLTAYLFYQGFALCSRGQAVRSFPISWLYWRAPILMYAICAGGNLLICALPATPAVVTDGSGRQWSTADILCVCKLVSVLVMGPMALLAWLRLQEAEGATR